MTYTQGHRRLLSQIGQQVRMTCDRKQAPKFEPKRRLLRVGFLSLFPILSKAFFGVTSLEFKCRYAFA